MVSVCARDGKVAVNTDTHEASYANDFSPACEYLCEGDVSFQPF